MLKVFLMFNDLPLGISHGILLLAQINQILSILWFDNPILVSLFDLITVFVSDICSVTVTHTVTKIHLF